MMELLGGFKKVGDPCGTHWDTQCLLSLLSPTDATAHLPSLPHSSPRPQSHSLCLDADLLIHLSVRSSNFSLARRATGSKRAFALKLFRLARSCRLRPPATFCVHGSVPHWAASLCEPEEGGKKRKNGRKEEKKNLFHRLQLMSFTRLCRPATFGDVECEWFLFTAAAASETQPSYNVLV